MSIFDLIKTTKLGYAGQQPPSTAIQPDTIHAASSVWGSPSFSGYKEAWLRKLKPTRLAAPEFPDKYLDHLPQ
jgi:hypothetical protein